jgi:site-specific recombinase
LHIDFNHPTMVLYLCAAVSLSQMHRGIAAFLNANQQLLLIFLAHCQNITSRMAISQFFSTSSIDYIRSGFGILRFCKLLIGSVIAKRVRLSVVVDLLTWGKTEGQTKHNRALQWIDIIVF